MTISRKIILDVAKFDRSTRGSVAYDAPELDRFHAWDISRLPQGAVLELLVHSYRPFRYPRENDPAGRFPSPHEWGRPDLHLIITADSNDVAADWEALFVNQYTSQHKPAA